MELFMMLMGILLIKISILQIFICNVLY